jgi:HSP20 family protein
MPEKSAAAVQIAPSRPPVKTGKPENLAEQANRLFEAISRRAFELFEQEGRADGHDVRHWTEAEREFLHPVIISLEETDNEIVARAHVPGFTASELEVTVEPRRVTITGARQSKKEKQEEGFHKVEQSSDEIFRTLELPSEVNAGKVSATLQDGTLDIRLPKLEVKNIAGGQQRQA